MKLVLVDTKFFGKTLKQARNSAHIKRTYAARILGTTCRHLQRYESGKELIPENILRRLLAHGFTLLTIKNNNPQNKQ